MLTTKIKRFLLVVFVFVLVLMPAALPAETLADTDTAFTKEEEEFIRECAPLKVGYVQDRTPVSLRAANGELGGISRLIFDRIAQLSGLTFDYVALPTGDVTYDYLLGEGFDLITSVEYNKQNQMARGILMSDPYLMSRKVIVASADLDFSVDKHLKVAISTGSQTIRKVLAERYPNFETVDYASMEACLDAVRAGEADILIQNQYIVEYWLYRPLYEHLKIIPVMGFDDALCFSAVTPLEGGEDEVWQQKETLIHILDKTIAMLTEDEISGFIIEGTMANPYRYTMQDTMYRYRYTFVLLAVAVVLIIVLVWQLLRARLRSINAKADAKARGDFLSTMSHEIRTPLNGLIGLNYLMNQNLRNEEKMKKYLRQSTSTARYLLSLLSDILDMSKLQESEMELERDVVDLPALLHSLEAMERSSMAEKKIDFSLRMHLPHAAIYGDEVRIQQILMNILDNARKFTSEGGHVTIIAGQKQLADGRIETTVDIADTGCGMSEEFHHQIFNSFTQERDTVSKGNQGTGLGMSISYRLAKLMGGDLRVVSKKDEGSCFTFVLPAEPAELPEGAEPEPEDTEDVSGAGGLGSILIAEDNELNGQILMELLLEEGYDVVLAENGREAVDAFAASEPGHFGIILMDLLMPVMDGHEAAVAIRAMDRPDAKTVRIIACTANAFKEDRDRAMASGMDDFITKPVDVEELLERLRR